MPRKKQVKGGRDKEKKSLTSAMAKEVASLTYSELLDAYIAANELWSYDKLRMMCQLEIERSDAMGEHGKKYSWAGYLIGLSKAMLEKEIAGSLTINHNYIVPEEVDTDGDNSEGE